MSWLRSPALHMAVIGGLMFGFSAWRGDLGLDDKPRIDVSRHRLELMFETFVADHRRPPTAAERQQMLDGLIDQEVLYHYALTLGMHENPAAQRRLAMIARFVEANPHGESASETELASVAMELGLHHGDLVVRRILEDSARRLIRAVVLLQDPTPVSVEEYFAARGEDFMRPARIRISQVLINSFKWPDTESRALELLARIRREELELDAVLALGDGAFVDSRLPRLDEQALATKLGHGFAATVFDLPEQEWSGPIKSRYGHHLVFVHERHEAYVPPFEEIRDEVTQRLREKLADEWLALRLKELRGEFEIVEPS